MKINKIVIYDETYLKKQIGGLFEPADSNKKILI